MDNTSSKLPLSSFLRGADHCSSISCTPMVTLVLHWFWPKRPKMAKKHLKLGVTPLFARFLMCTSIIFFWVAAQGPKSSFFNPKLGARLKNMGLRGRRTHSEEGGAYINPSARGTLYSDWGAKRL